MKLIIRILKSILPRSLIQYLRKNLVDHKIKENLKAAFIYDYNRYLSHSSTIKYDTQTKLISKIIIQYHVVEKGLTMPEPRLGFGKIVIEELISNCFDYIEKFGKTEEQLLHAIEVILAYEDFHKTLIFDLESSIIESIQKIKSLNRDLTPCVQIEMSKNKYFDVTGAPFPLFSKSRKSVRNYTEEDIPMEKIYDALNIAKNAPSVCNRQTWRTHIYRNKKQISEILEQQNGNRGFGHLANKLILVTADLGAFNGFGERNQAFIYGGIYAMNLLYGLHYYQIAACILNCSNTVEKDMVLRKVTKIKDSEVFIAIITCGIPPEKFKIAVSKRYDPSHTNTTIN